MSHAATRAGDERGPAHRLKYLSAEASAGATTAATLLPSCLAAGVVAFGPLGPDYAAAGLVAALLATVVGGLAAAMFSTSTFVVSFPLPSLAVVQGSLVLSLLGLPAFAAQPALVIPAMAACVMLTGLLIVFIARTGISGIIKYTPHPVMAGFKNGISLTLIWLQVRPFLDLSFQQQGPLPFLAGHWQLTATLVLLLLIFGLDSVVRKIPAALLGIIIGALLFHVLGSQLPGIDFGRTLGKVAIELPPAMPLLSASEPGVLTALTTASPQIIQYAVVLALFVTLQSLLAYRLAQSLHDAPLDPNRNLGALGVGTCLSAAVGGLAISGASGQSVTAFRSGGRTRVVSIAMCALLAVLSIAAPSILALVPIAAISAVVIHTAIQTLDPWSVSLAKRVLGPKRRGIASRDWYDLAISTAVMLVTACVAVLPGVALGIVLACLVFIVNMSKPLIHRKATGVVLTSKRVRKQEDALQLRSTGERRTVLELSGVLFFGNAETLSAAVSDVFDRSDMVLLDCRGISDVDASGMAVMRTLVERAAKAKRRIQFCNIAPLLKPRFDEIASHGRQPAPFIDLDTALEWMEEQVLAKVREAHAPAESTMGLASHDFVRGLSVSELEAVSAVLQLRSFSAGATLCAQGDIGDRMWLLMNGSVSIRIATDDVRGTRRVASLAQGTTVGEMALIEDGRRSATIVANESVESLELSKAAYREILERHPAIAAKLLGNLLREMTARIRDNHLELREAVS